MFIKQKKHIFYIRLNKVSYFLKKLFMINYMDNLCNYNSSLSYKYDRYLHSNNLEDQYYFSLKRLYRLYL